MKRYTSVSILKVTPRAGDRFIRALVWIFFGLPALAVLAWVGLNLFLLPMLRGSMP